MDLGIVVPPIEGAALQTAEGSTQLLGLQMAAGWQKATLYNYF